MTDSLSPCFLNLSICLTASSNDNLFRQQKSTVVLIPKTKQQSITAKHPKSYSAIEIFSI